MLYPMFGMVMLTLLIALIAIRIRFSSVLSGRVSIKYFRLMQGDAEESVIKTTRAYNNMFEVPVLFYVVGTLYIVFDKADIFAIVIAWLFVVFRCVQAFINISYNNVLHRMLAFWGGWICVFILWLYLVFLRAFSFTA